jgi:hypothetical protein
MTTIKYFISRVILVINISILINTILVDGLISNFIQTYESTLRFNETLFVNHNNKKVGILTDPTYTLDVNGEIYNDSLTTFGKLNISDVLQERQQVSTIWVGTGNFVDAYSSNVRYSYDGENWESPINIPNMLAVNTVAYNGSLWIGAGNATASNSMIQYSSNLSQWNTTTGDLFTPEYQVLRVAWNGSIWVAVGNGTNTILTSTDGLVWIPATSGGFTGVSPSGQGIAWTGSRWVAVGTGGTGGNSILTSVDGSNWAPATGTTFINQGYGVASTNVCDSTPANSTDAMTKFLQNYYLRYGPI